MTERDYRTAEEDRRIIVQRASFRVAMLDAALYAVRMAVPGLDDEVGRRLAALYKELEEIREKSATIANWWVEDERMTEFYRMKMVNGDIICTDTNPLSLTGDWAIIDRYWGGITGA